MLFSLPVVMASLVIHEAGGVKRVVRGPIRELVVVDSVKDKLVVVCARVDIAQELDSTL